MLYCMGLRRRREEKKRAVFLSPVLTESEEKATGGKQDERKDKEELLCALLSVFLETNKTDNLEVFAWSFLRCSRCIYHWKLRYKASWFVLAVGRGRSQSCGCMCTYTRELHALRSLLFIHQSTCIEAKKRKAARQEYYCRRFSLTFPGSTKIQLCSAICVNTSLLLGNVNLGSCVFSFLLLFGKPYLTFPSTDRF